MTTHPFASRNLQLARQPILDRQRTLVGFELLFRPALGGGDGPTDGRTATAEVIIGAFLELGIDKVLGGRLGFLNLDAQMLFDDAVLLLPREKLVLELLETISIDDAVVARTRELARRGYRLALDDVVACDRLERLLPLVDVVKIDVLAVPPQNIGALLERVRECSGRPVQLLAEKVETRAQMHACMELGFDLFQGYHFARPETLSGRRLERSRVALLRLLALSHSNASTDALVAEIRHHPQIAYGLMRLVNSAGMGLAENVGSLRQAIVVLGSRQLGRWIQLLVYGEAHSSRLAPGSGMDPVMILAATRARLLELLAEIERPGDLGHRDGGFLTGVFSLLDVLLDAPMVEICGALKLAPEVERALLRREGSLGRLLELAEKLEARDHASIERSVAGFTTLSPQIVAEAELAALTWANEVGDGTHVP